MKPELKNEIAEELADKLSKELNYSWEELKLWVYDYLNDKFPNE